MKCKKLREEVNKYNITSHPIAKELKQDVFSLTKHFPEKISFSFRIRAVAEQKECKCEACGTVHGHPDKAYCSHKCYLTVKAESAVGAEASAHKARVKRADKKFAGKKEGIDYLVCAICGVKSGDLDVHVRMHDIAPSEYKQKYGLRYLKPENNRLNRQGENNPAYGHGGKYSAWSKNFVHGYDEQRHKEKNLRQAELVKENPHLFKNTLEYWLNETDGNAEEATALLKMSQTRDLDYFITKYGEEDGRKRYELKTARWLKTLNEKSVDELAKINAAKVKKSGCFYSAGEKELFRELRKMVPLSEQLALCRNPDGENKLFYLYDMALGKRIIEYNGDFWHANPTKYDAQFVNPYSKRTAREVWNRDMDKTSIAIANGYTVKHVWESDYKNNKEKVVQECLNFLTQQNENSQT